MFCVPFLLLLVNTMEADADTLVAQIAQRWDIEVLFADVKELSGLDHYQLMSAQAIR
jgi:hypothetical protein